MGHCRGSCPQQHRQTNAGWDDYKEITLSPGLAIDGTGREIVVPEAVLLSAELFEQLFVAINDPDAWYPVLLTGRDEPASQNAVAVGACYNAQPTRRVEGFDVSFRSPGDELDLETQPAPDVAEGPGSTAWKILLGFVKWGSVIKRFTDVRDASGGIGRRYAGVQADVVAARSGQLTMRTRSDNEAGKPALVMNETAEWVLQFGKLTAQGAVTPVFSVNEKGDVKAEGKFIEASTPRSTQVESGIATDGTILPLPPGITQKQVDDGEAVVQVHISLWIDENAAPAMTGNWAATPREMWVDNERRVHCRVRWLRIAGAGAEDHSGACKSRPCVCEGQNTMNDKMQVLFVKQTGHVLVAFTRTADPEGKLQVSDLTGSGLFVRNRTSVSANSLSGGETLVVPAEALDVAVVDYDPDVFTTPIGFVASGGRVARLEAEEITLAPVTKPPPLPPPNRHPAKVDPRRSILVRRESPLSSNVTQRMTKASV